MGEAICDLNKKRQRIQWVDTARVIGIFLIVLGHTLRDGTVRAFAYSFHVPLFFFLSGFCFSAKKDSFKSFFIKKFKAIVVPYLIFAFVSLVIFYFLGAKVSDSLDVNTVEFSWIKFILGIFYANGKTGYLKTNLPLWFLPCFFVFSFLMYFCEKAVDKFFSKLKNPQIILMLFFVAISVTNLLVLKIKKLPYGAETAVNMMPFGLLGVVFRKNETKFKDFINKKIQKNSLKIILSVLAIIILGLLIWIVGVRLNETVNYYVDFFGFLPYFYISSLCGIGLIYLLSDLISQHKSYNFVSYIAKNTIPILTMHKFPILFFQVFIPFTANCIKNNNAPVAIVAALITIVLCLIVGQIIMKICPWVFGRPYKK